MAAKKLVSLADMIQAGGDSTIDFGHLFLPKTFRLPSPAFHYEMGQDLDGPRRLLAFKIFRDGAKTSILRTYAMKRICYALSNVIMIVSAKAEHAALTVQWIRNRLEDSALIRDAFHLEKGSKWTEGWVEIIRKDYPEGDPRRKVTIFAAGLTGQIRGFNVDDFRPDLILLDDGQTEESVGTAEQSKKTSDLTFGALQNSLVPHAENPQAKMVVLQTPMEHGDVIDIVTKSPLWTTKSFGIFDEQGRSRWEGRYPTAQLHAEKAEAIRIGKYSMWMREREVSLVRSEQQVFDMSQVRIATTLPNIIHDRAAGIDPASSDDKRADNQACVIALRNGPDIYIVSCHAAKGEMPDELANYFFQAAHDWKPRIVRVEPTAYQRTLAWYLGEEMRKRRRFYTISREPDNRKKSDRIIQALAGLVAHGHLHFYAPTGILDPDLQALYDEMASYEPMSSTKKDDRVDAAAMAVTVLNNQLGDDTGGSIEQAVARERREYSFTDVDDEPLLVQGAP